MVASVTTYEKKRIMQLWKLETQKLGLSRQASQSFQNKFPAFDTGIAWNSKMETHSGNLVKTEPKGHVIQRARHISRKITISL
jgi:type II secretory pathway component PulL